MFSVFYPNGSWGYDSFVAALSQVGPGCRTFSHMTRSQSSLPAGSTDHVSSWGCSISEIGMTTNHPTCWWTESLRMRNSTNHRWVEKPSGVGWSWPQPSPWCLFTRCKPCHISGDPLLNCTWPTGSELFLVFPRPAMFRAEKCLALKTGTTYQYESLTRKIGDGEQRKPGWWWLAESVM